MTQTNENQTKRRVEGLYNLERSRDKKSKKKTSVRVAKRNEETKIIKSRGQNHDRCYHFFFHLDSTNSNPQELTLRFLLRQMKIRRVRVRVWILIFDSTCLRHVWFLPPLMFVLCVFTSPADLRFLGWLFERYIDRINTARTLHHSCDTIIGLG